MPVNTAITLLPPTSPRLRFDSSPGDSSSDSPSFQDTLQRASSPSDDTPKASATDTAPEPSVPAKADGTQKLKSSDSSKSTHRTKSKKAKAAEEDASDEHAVAADDDGEPVPVEQASDATDDSPAKNAGKSKTKAAAAADLTATAANAATAVAAAPVVPQQAAAAAASGSVDSNAKPDPGKAAAAAAVVKQAGTETTKNAADTDNAEPRADGDEVDLSTEGQAVTSHQAAAKLSIQSKAASKPVHKSTAQPESKASKTGNATSTAATTAAAALEATAGVADVLAPDAADADAKTLSPVAGVNSAGEAAIAAPLTSTSTKAAPASAAVDAGAKALTTSEAQFADTNHNKIVSAVHGQLLPTGGTMQIRLDPAELGSLQINVQVKNGTMTATFETSNADATRLLSHSLGDLRTVLEQAGVTVEKIHVQQSAKPDSQSGGGDGQQQGQSEQNPQAKQEQQRRELLQKMWQKLSGGDPLDLTA